MVSVIMGVVTQVGWQTCRQPHAREHSHVRRGKLRQARTWRGEQAGSREEESAFWLGNWRSKADG